MLPTIEIPTEMKARLLSDYAASNVKEPLTETICPEPKRMVRYSVPLAFLEKYPRRKNYVTG